MRLTLLLPTINEVEGVQRTMRRVPRERLTKMGHALEIVLIDASSTDGTQEAARKLGAHVIDEPQRGYGRAYKTGLAAAKGDIVVTADADDTYPLDLLPELLEQFLKGGYDFATIDRLASVEKRAMSKTNRFGNWVLTSTARTLYRVRIHDSQSGMWFLTRRALQRLPIDELSDGMAFSQEIKLHAFRDPNLKSVELPGRYYTRVGDVKLLRWRDGLRNLRHLVGGRFRMSKPRHTSR